MSSATSPDEVYRERAARFAAEEDRARRRFDRVANLRLLAFFAAAGFAAAGIWLRQPLLAAPTVALLAVFAALVRYHGRLGRRRRRAALLRGFNEEARHRLARAWDSLPPCPDATADAGHPYAADLDLFGRASLLQLLDTTAVPMGRAALRRWLLAPSPVEVALERQASVAELAPLLELREELRLRGRLLGEVGPGPAPFLAWAESSPWLGPRRVVVWAARLCPALLLTLFAGWATRLLPVPAWLPFLIGNLALWLLLAGRTERTLGEVRRRAGEFRAYGEGIALLAGATLHSGALTRLQRAVELGGRPAERHLRRLDRLTELAISPVAPLYFVVQALFLWNVHVLVALEGWQRRVGPRARAWLDALGEFEALAAMAGLAHAHPDWAYPQLDETADSVDGCRLGHPLIAPAVRVDNDVALGPPGTFLLVTGSNMSGKSTLLRTIGLNTVLAGAGAPVCAAGFRMPPVDLWTSMRVADSLEHGVSHFLAELRRLKQIVDAAGRDGSEGRPRLCFLLDEVLQGTNTDERQVAARRVIRHLVAQGGLGAVSTHDLTLADSPGMAAIARLAHFTETVSDGAAGPAMSFDYRLRPGPATSRNALRLMALVGLNLE